MSGTALRGGLTRLIAPTEKAEGLMKKYGISVQKTADGNVDNGSLTRKTWWLKC